MQNHVSKQITPKNCFNCNQCLSSTTNLMRLRYAWLDILFKSANQNILLRFDSFEKPYKQRERMSHRDIQKLENNGQKHSFFFLLFSFAQGQGHHNSVSQLLWARSTYPCGPAVPIPVNFPCGRKPEYPEKTHDFRQSVDFTLFTRGLVRVHHTGDRTRNLRGERRVV